MYVGMANGKPCKISEDAPNRSVCITGLSGTGKTVRLNQLELAGVQEGATVLVLDVGRTHAAEEIFRPLRERFSREVNRLNAMEGLGLGLFQTLETPQGRKEAFANIVNSAVQALSSGQRMGVCQMAALREAVIAVVRDGGTAMDEAEALESVLGSRDDDRSIAVYQKLWTLLHCGALGPAAKCLQAGKINILDMSDMDRITQTTLAEIILHTLWRKIRFFGLPKDRMGFTIVLDEFQNLPLKKDAVLCDMLREGRKFGVNFLLATQSLESFPREVHPLISQTAVRLYFRPAPGEAGGIARKIERDKADTWSKILLNLNVGQSVAVGDFQVGGMAVKRPLILSGYENYD